MGTQSVRSIRDRLVGGQADEVDLRDPRRGEERQEGTPRSGTVGPPLQQGRRAQVGLVAKASI